MADCINGGNNNNSQRQQPWSSFVGLKDVTLFFAFLTLTTLLSLAVYNSESSVQQLFNLPAFASTPIPTQSASYKTNTSMAKDVGALERVLLEAATKEKTVILTTLNRAWAEPNSTFDLFLEGFHVGVGTKRFLHHLVDMDIMWLRDPFPHLFSEVDFQIACDHYNGNSNSTRNPVNGGFKFVQANPRTVMFYKYWYESRWTFCGKNEQDVFNIIKHDRFVTKELGLTMRFLDTVYFRGFCQLHGEMEKICTMHANCCLGLHNKINDLRQVLQDWRGYLSTTDHQNMTWRSPDRCRGSMSNISLIV
ncbi:unnamed protein product [Eruca vesicaria subsp. sativa]|uniref:Nucleotide-diphospho-sugar transferase domain-containing protein n=1 Tax=Eruca vesicaria subsp. sativa TaxID=29727 RepID=A0ABC8J1U6_ERUVS|nr:unnamed protein product [Eruca vesicaria subsp. sativa]